MHESREANLKPQNPGAARAACRLEAAKSDSDCCRFGGLTAEATVRARLDRTSRNDSMTDHAFTSKLLLPLNSGSSECSSISLS